MTRNVLMLTGLFVVSFCGLLWLTAAEHRGNTAAVVTHAESASVNKEASELATPAIEPEATTQTTIDAEEASNEAVADAEALGAFPANFDEALAQPVDTEPLQSINSATRALQSSTDRGARLAALNALLLQGRQSSVNPAITQALKFASSDSDPLVAAQANSALSETGREMD